MKLGTRFIVGALAAGLLGGVLCRSRPEPSPFAHVVIPAPDLGNAKRFYERVFAWTVDENVPAPTYWFFESGNVGGAFDAQGRAAPGSILLFISVEDMSATIRRIEEHGGRIVEGRRRIGDAAPGYTALFLDPNGNRMGIYSED